MGTDRELEYLEGFEQVLIWSSHLDHNDGVDWDISPNSIGNATLPTDPADFIDFYDVLNGGDDSQGYSVNPVTGEAFPVQMVPRGDYGRVLAEFWADGPDSETPPGHWFTLLNDVMDHPSFERKLGGEGPVLSELEFDIKAYFALGGCMHDVAITAWGVKGYYDYVRPVRWFDGWPKWSADRPFLRATTRVAAVDPGLIELITFDLRNLANAMSIWLALSIRTLARSRRLLGVVQISSMTQPSILRVAIGFGPELVALPTAIICDPKLCGLRLGHSTYSRAAAELLTLLTGSPYFPGGLGEYVALGTTSGLERGPQPTSHCSGSVIATRAISVRSAAFGVASTLSRMIFPVA